MPEPAETPFVTRYMGQDLWEVQCDNCGEEVRAASYARKLAFQSNHVCKESNERN